MEKITVHLVVKLIRKLKTEARNRGEKVLEITASDLHNIIGKYPNGNTRYPTCCNAMYKEMKANDEILHTTKSRYSLTIKVRYYLD
ncbi:MAG: hypothetical protein ABS882_09145 [Lysinibacillus sp.]